MQRSVPRIYHVRKFGGRSYDGGSANGFHVVKRSSEEAGEWESVSGPHFSYLQAWLALEELTLKERGVVRK